MTYLIREMDGRWLIFACGDCILDCESEAVALATVAAASALLQQPARGATFASRSRSSAASAA